MQFKIERSALYKALSHCQSVVERRTTLPILSHILLDVEGVSVKITATDLELSIVETVSAEVAEPGRATVPAHLIHEIVRKMEEKGTIFVSFDKESHQLWLKCGASEFKLPCLPPEDFPVIQAGDLPCQFKVPSRLFLRLLERTRFAMSQDETRYFLNGIFLHPVEGKELRAVATDGHRLAMASMPLPEGASDFQGVIIPRKTVQEVIKLIAETPEDIRVAVSPTQICFSIRHAFLTSRLIDGNYPAYEEAIPMGNNQMMYLKVAPFAKAVDRVATISLDKLGGIHGILEQGKLILKATGEVAGSAQEEIAVEYTGEPVNLGFNARYILDITQQLTDEKAQFALSGDHGAMVIRPANDNTALYVLMPMSV